MFFVLGSGMFLKDHYNSIKKDEDFML